MSSEFLNVLASGVFAPKPKTQQWVSESGVKFHLEKPVSVAAAMGDFTALCGISGQFFYDKYEGQTFLCCADCLEVASRPTGIAPVTDRVAVGDDSGGASSVCAPVESLPVPLTGNGVSGDGELPQGRSVSIADADSQSLPSDTARGIAGVQSTATDCTPEVFSYFPLAETVERIIANPRLTLKQRIDFEMWKQSSRNFSVSSHIDPAYDRNGRY